METSLGKEIINHMSMHIGESTFQTVVIKSESFVIESQKVK